MYHVIIPTKVINLKLNSDYILAKVPDYLIEVQYLIKLKTRQHSKTVSCTNLKAFFKQDLPDQVAMGFCRETPTA